MATRMIRPILTFWLPWVLANAVAAGASVAVIWGVIHAGWSGSLPEVVVAAVWVSGLLFAAVGAMVGVAQWVVLRRLIAGAGGWIAASAFGAVVGTAAVGLFLNLLSWAWAPWSVGWLATGASGGAAVGAVQWVVLRRAVGGAGWWVLASAAAASAGAIPYYLLTLGDDGICRVTAGGTIAGVAYGAITGVACLLLKRRSLGGTSFAGIGRGNATGETGGGS